MNRAQWTLTTDVAVFYLVASPQGLQGLLWHPQDVPMATSLESSAPEVQILAKTVRQLGEYLDGKRREFDVPIDVTGTAFQQRVWHELSRIPYGETRSYRDIAKRLQNENAVRAVGTANGRNPISIIVPCHRVIGADGTLTGYAGGLATKAKLLEIERRGTSLE